MLTRDLEGRLWELSGALRNARSHFATHRPGRRYGWSPRPTPECGKCRRVVCRLLAAVVAEHVTRSAPR